MPSLPTLADVKAKALDAKDYSAKRVSRMQSPASKNLNWDMTKKPPPPPPEQKPELVYSKTFAPPPPRRGGAPTSPTSPAASGPPPIARRPTIPARPGSNESYGSSPAQPSLPPRLPARSQSTLSSTSQTSAPSPPPRLPGRPTPPSQRSAPSVSPAVSPPLPSRSPSSRAIAEGEPKIDWTNLSPEDKHEFFTWLDEFFTHRTGKPAPPRTAPRAAAPALRLQPPMPPARGVRALSVSPSASSQASPISQSSPGGPPPIRRVTRPHAA